MFVSGTINGDNFPDGEAWMYDATGNGISLGDYQHPWYGSPMWSLMGNGKDNIINFNITVNMNDDGTFKSAFYKKGEKTYNLTIFDKKRTNFNPKDLEKR